MDKNDIEARVAGIGYQVTRPQGETIDGLPVDGPLIVALENDGLGRERLLMIDLVPTDPEDPIELVQFRLVYPIVLEGEDDTVADVLRTMLLLNRALVIGHNGLAEESQGLYFAYTMLIGRESGLDAAALADAIGLIDYLTEWQGELFDQVVRGEIDVDGVLAALAERELEPQPLFFRRDAA